MFRLQRAIIRTKTERSQWSCTLECTVIEWTRTSFCLWPDDFADLIHIVSLTVINCYIITTHNSMANIKIAQIDYKLLCWSESGQTSTIFTASSVEKWINICTIIILYIGLGMGGGGTRWHSWLRHCATTRNVAGSIPDGVIGIFHWHNPSDRTMALGLSQPLTEMSTRNISWGV